MTAMDMGMVGALQWAVARREFTLHFQPQIDLRTGESVAMEALLRWQHPTRGLLEPREFLSMAMGSDLIVAIGRWVLEECVREVGVWQSLHQADAKPCELWANISAVELTQPGFVDWFLGFVAEAGIDPTTLGLEVTENELVASHDDTRVALNAVKDAGIKLAVDDFTSWYSSLAHLNDIAFDAVKLDQRFVRGAGNDIVGDQVAEAIVKLAHSRGLVVIAEGVESWAEGARLCELGADRAHGYLFSPPLRSDRARWVIGRSLGWAVPSTLAPGQPIPDQPNIP